MFFKKLGCLLIVIALSISNILPVSAETIPQLTEIEYSDIQKNVTTVTVLLEEMLNLQYQNTIEDIKEMCEEKGYDFELTTNQIYEQGNPFKNMQYAEIIAAYMTCKEYYEGKTTPCNSIGNLPFITYSVKEHDIDEAIPYKIEKFEQLDNGLYQKTGYEYSVESKDIQTYKEVSDGLYEKSELKHIDPENIKTKYADITFKIIDRDGVFSYFEVPMQDVNDDYQQRLEKINMVSSTDILRQNIFISMPTDDSDYLQIDMNDITGIRKVLIETAASLMGKVPYQWGGKSTRAGYDTSWWTFENETGIQKGLDCSGFVQWVYRTAGFDESVWGKMQSTTTINSAGFTEISKEDLQPGDIGILNRSKNNHTGIYAGNGKWIHCSSEKGTVVLADYDFKIFYRVVEDEDLTTPLDGDEKLKVDNTAKNIDNDSSMVYYTNKGENTDDVLLLARLIEHEAGNEGLNGWVAVGEVVLNRVNSTLFPNTLYDVVYAPHQFSFVSQINAISPRNEIMEVSKELLSGRIRIFNNPNVLYFKNPTITNGIKADVKKDWGSHQYYQPVGHHAFYLQ